MRPRGADSGGPAAGPAVKRALRLRREEDFRRLRASRRSWAHPLAALYVAANELGRSRVGITVGKRVAKQAVARNRIRRRLREAVRLRYPRLRPGLDLLLVARAPSARAEWAELDRAVGELLQRARLLHDG